MSRARWPKSKARRDGERLPERRLIKRPCCLLASTARPRFDELHRGRELASSLFYSPTASDPTSPMTRAQIPASKAPDREIAKSQNRKIARAQIHTQSSSCRFILKAALDSLLQRARLRGTWGPRKKRLARSLMNALINMLLSHFGVLAHPTRVLDRRAASRLPPPSAPPPPASR